MVNQNQSVIRQSLNWWIRNDRKTQSPENGFAMTKEQILKSLVKQWLKDRTSRVWIHNDRETNLQEPGSTMIGRQNFKRFDPQWIGDRTSIVWIYNDAETELKQSGSSMAGRENFKRLDPRLLYRVLFIVRIGDWLNEHRSEVERVIEWGR